VHLTGPLLYREGSQGQGGATVPREIKEGAGTLASASRPAFDTAGKDPRAPNSTGIDAAC